MLVKLFRNVEANHRKLWRGIGGGCMGKECKNISFEATESWGFDYNCIKSDPELMFLLFFC